MPALPRSPPKAEPHLPSTCLAPQSLASNVVEAFYRLEPFLKAAVYEFVLGHLPEYTQDENGVPKEFWVSFYNLEVRVFCFGAAGPCLMGSGKRWWFGREGRTGGNVDRRLHAHQRTASWGSGHAWRAWVWGLDLT